MSGDVQKYEMDERFERTVVAFVCLRPRFYGRVGHAIEADAMPSDPGRLAVLAAQAIAKDTGAGPDSEALVMQRLTRMVGDGKITHEQKLAVADMIEDALNDPRLPAEEGVVNELAAMLRSRLEHTAVRKSFDLYTKRRDMGEVIDMLTSARTLGVNDVSLGVKLGASSFALIEAMKGVQKLATGIGELDTVLGGGLPRKQLGVLVGGSGDGKSMTLSHIAACTIRKGIPVAYATLELPVETVLARIKSNITQVPIEQIVDGSQLAKDRLARVHHASCFIKFFTPGVTTVEDVASWIKTCEEDEKSPVPVTIVDYGDKLTARVPGLKKEEGAYKTMERVYEGLRIHALDRDGWSWTASQSTRKQKDKKRLDLEDVSDSINKIRVADLVITLNAQDDGNEMVFHVAKNRTGKSRQSVGPMPVDFACGQLSVIPWDDNNPNPDAVPF